MGILFVLLSILKIIGIIILAIFVVLLLLLCVVLFVPFKYYITAEKYEAIKGSGSFTWLFGALEVEGKYVNDEILTTVKVFGVDIEAWLKKRNEKRRAKIRKKRKKHKQEIMAQSKTVRKKEETSVKKIEKITSEQVKTEPVKEVVKEEIKAEAIPLEIQKPERAVVKRIKMSEIEPEKEIVKPIIIKKEEPIKDKEEKKEEKKKKVDIDYFNEMPTEEKKAVLRACIKLIKKVLKGVLPKNVSADLTIGTGDPEMTGYVIAMAAILQGTVASDIKVKGNFGEEMLEGCIKILGSIQIATLFVATIKFAITKPIRKIIRTYMKGKGE